MIPDLQSCLLCDDVRQERNGKFMLIGLFDAIASPQMPIGYPRLFMVTRWCSGVGEFTQQARILKPDQTSILVSGKEIAVRLPNPEATATNVECIVNVAFDVPGTHWVEVMLDGDLKLRYPLRVSKLQQQPGGNPPRWAATSAGLTRVSRAMWRRRPRMLLGGTVIVLAGIAGWLLRPVEQVEWESPTGETYEVRKIAGMTFVKLGTIWIGQHEVSARQVSGWKRMPGGSRPAGLSLIEARTFASWMTDRHEGTFRLPTAAEWEHAARGGLRGQPYPWGAGVPDEDIAFDTDGPVPVHRGPANGYGLKHTAGNVFEWVEEGHARGGSWAERHPDLLRVDRATTIPEDYSGPDVGLRLVWVP